MEKEESSVENDEMTCNNIDAPLIEPIVQESKCSRFSITIEPVVFFIFFADGFSDSVLPNFILMRTCENHFHYNTSVCSSLGNSEHNQTDIEKKIQPYSTLLITSMSFMGAFCPAIISLFVGPWSDLNGRKPLIIISTIGYFFKYTILLVLTYFPKLGPEYALLAIPPVSLSGGIIVFLSAMFAYISDVSSEKNRFLRISILEGVLALGLSCGIVILANTFKPSLPNCYGIVYGICSGLTLISVIYIYFFVPESLKNPQRENRFKGVFTTKHIKEMLDICFRERKGVRRLLLFLSIATVTISITTGAGNANVIYYFSRLRFNWDIKEFTFWVSVNLPLVFFGIFPGVFIFYRWLKIHEALLGFVGSVAHVVLYFYIAFIPPNQPHLIYYACVINIFAGILGPMCRVLLCKAAPKQDLGKVFALTGCCESIFPLIGGPVYTALYNATINTLPNAFLLLTGSLYVVCSVIFIIIYYDQRKYAEEDYNIMENETSCTDRSSPDRDIGFFDKWMKKKILLTHEPFSKTMAIKFFTTSRRTTTALRISLTGVMSFRENNVV